MSHLASHPSLPQNPLLSLNHNVEVIFGTPSKNCDGVGICHINGIDHVRVQWKCPHACACLFRDSSGHLQMIFDRQRLPSNYAERYFANEEFVMEEPYVFPAALCKLLEIGSHTVNPGRYQVRVSERFFKIIF